MIEIPGYRLQRPLGRGGMATVYLALQESVQREVALKVMSPTLLGDPEFGERFLREARIAAKLRHPHVVQVHDVGRAGDHHYIAMEYLPGGPVLTRNGAPRDLAFALRVTREIAGALGYAQQKGIVHRDIKPDNILLREDGAAVLTDFGIAHASDNVRMTRTGAIIGTPHYMSPEQARGLPLDGRADLYSLGIVFYEMLAGRVPYQAEDSLAVGIMHITAPLPRLPESLESLQPLLDRMLAKEPADRFQDGAELAREVAALERDLAGTTRILPAVPPPPPPPPPPRAGAGSRVTPAHDGGTGARGERAEPTLGRIDEVLREPLRRARPQRRARRGQAASVVLAAVLIGGGAAAWHFQEPLRELWPQTRQNELLERADMALQHDRLAGADGQGARELYAAVLALDPDSQRAREGLRRVGVRLLEAARVALDSNDLPAARAALSQARELDVPAAEVAALQQAIDARASRDVELGSLLERGRAAQDAGRVDGDEGAVALYRRALAADPGNAIAGAGLREVLALKLEQARAAAEDGRHDEAAAGIEAVAAIDPAHLGLPEARGALAAALASRRAALEAKLDQADALLAKGRLTAPADANARSVYLEVLQQEPANPRARDGLRRIASTLVSQAQRRIADYEFDRGAELLDLAQQVDAGVPGLAAARDRLRELQARRGAAQGNAASPASQARIAQLLDDARRAAEAGNLLAPPGESAYDRYRAVQALEPGNVQARAGLAALPALARQRFEAAIGENRLLAARGTIEALQTLAPADPALPAMRRRLARSLLGQADERLGAGEIGRATEAFNQARELDPNNPDLAAMQARLDQASGG